MAISETLRNSLIDEFRSQTGRGTEFAPFLAGDAVIRAAWIESLARALSREMASCSYTHIDCDTMGIIMDAAAAAHSSASTAARERYRQVNEDPRRRASSSTV
ncbi:hypothetical protein [Prescottella agglutinans]|uniref:hypothetical protein n=1 Tax=Prescottella agglutinans TaxID=1644129 RepID=UPI003D99F4F3